MDALDLSRDVVMIAAADAAAAYALSIRKRFEGGMIAAAWHFIGPAMVVFALSWPVHVVNDVFRISDSEEIHLVLQLISMLLLFYGFFILDRFWGRKASL